MLRGIIVKGVGDLFKAHHVILCLVARLHLSGSSNIVQVDLDFGAFLDLLNALLDFSSDLCVGTEDGEGGFGSNISLLVRCCAMAYWFSKLTRPGARVRLTSHW